MAGVGAARLSPAFEVAQLAPENRALDAVHAVIVALQDVMVAPVLPPVAQHAHLFHLLVIVGDDHAAFAVSAEVLAGIEAEAAGDADAAGALPLVFGTVRLARILYHRNAVRVANLHDRVH